VTPLKHKTLDHGHDSTSYLPQAIDLCWQTYIMANVLSLKVQQKKPT
jgi:hypothetical protein